MEDMRTDLLAGGIQVGGLGLGVGGFGFRV